MVSFPECFPPDHIAELKHDHLYGALAKWLKAIVAYLKDSANENHTLIISSSEGG